MTDQRECACHDGCSGWRGGPGCTSEPTNYPHGGYRPPYLAARQPVSSSRRITERDVAFLFPGHRPALRVVRGEYDGRHGDPGDEHVERKGGL